MAPNKDIAQLGGFFSPYLGSFRANINGNIESDNYSGESTRAHACAHTHGHAHRPGLDLAFTQMRVADSQFAPMR